MVCWTNSDLAGAAAYFPAVECLALGIEVIGQADPLQTGHAGDTYERGTASRQGTLERRQYRQTRQMKVLTNTGTLHCQHNRASHRAPAIASLERVIIAVCDSGARDCRASLATDVPSIS